MIKRGLHSIYYTAVAPLFYRILFFFYFSSFKPYTMVPRQLFIQNLLLVKRYKGIKGDVVECGTWKGGCIAAMAKVLGESRDYYLFDSFEGLPPAKEIDGDEAIKWQNDKKSEFYFNNCTASVSDAQEAMKKSQISSYTITKGWFEESLPTFKSDKGIAVLRLDADWYDSTMLILNVLFDQVNIGGLILIDDYHTWNGCSKAVHDYLSKNNRDEKILNKHGVCFIIKR
jgi:O-methyltransferase